MVAAGDFLYSINGQDFQSSNVFHVTTGGLYTCTVKEKNNCGTKTQKFIVLVAPEFFTPNNDGYNDTWYIKGLLNYPEAQVKIFDRYGKFIIELNHTTFSWDGTLNGKELPSSDYWYVATINDSTPEKRGHFSLKR
jgi:gliding motility-associated-like protein